MTKYNITFIAFLIFGFLCLPPLSRAQSGSAYYDLSVASDGVTIYGYDVMDTGMSGPSNCYHTYQMRFGFMNSAYNSIGTNGNPTISESDPANQSKNFRIDNSMVTDGSDVTTYYAAPSASAYCECVSQQFVSLHPTPMKLGLKKTVYSLTSAVGGCSYSADCIKGQPTCASGVNAHYSYNCGCGTCAVWLTRYFLVIYGSGGSAFCNEGYVRYNTDNRTCT